METGLHLPQSSTGPALLRPDQIEDMEGEREALKVKLRDPQLQDRGAALEQLQRVERQLETQRPRPYASHEIDKAVKREAELRATWTQGMLSHEEMRKAPHGAVDRHRAWEKKNKALILEWQNIQRRLNAGNDDRESASIERFRPVTSTMNMQGALITGKQFFLQPEGVGPATTFSDGELDILRDQKPELAAMIGLMTNEQRAQAKIMLYETGVFTNHVVEFVDKGEPEKIKVKVKKKKMTVAERKAFAEKMRVARLAKQKAV